MRQGSRGVKTAADAKRTAGGSARKPPKTKVQAKRVIAKKAPKRQGSKERASEKRLAEALEREKAIGEILRVMSVSPGDVQPVLEAVAERAAHLCDAPYANVLIRDGEVLRPSAFSRLPERTSVLPIPLTRGSANGRAVLERTTLHHADIVPFLDTEFPDARQNTERLGVRAHLAVPLLREGEACGTIVVFRREPRAFSREQIALVETFARQAVIAIENVRLFNETREALEQQTAISEILRVISSSPTDVQPMLNSVVERAAKLSEAANATIFLAEGDKYYSVARFGDANRALELGQFIPLTRGSAAGRAMIDLTTIHLEEVATVSEDEYPMTRQWQRIIGHRTLLAVPLLREERAIGALSLWRLEVRPFTEKQINLVKTFADQAAIAIENVRLFNETREALERQTATAEILSVISESPADVQPVFDAIVRSAKRVFGALTAVATRVVGDSLHLAAFSATGPDSDEALKRMYPIPIMPGTLVGLAASTGQIVAVNDVLTDPRARPAMREVAQARGFRSILVAPMLRDGLAIGTINITRAEPGGFSDHQQALIKTFADQAVIAIENVRLFDEVQARTRELSESLQQQMATADVLKVISRSAFDLQKVLDTLTESACKLCEAEGANILRPDADGFKVAAMFGQSPAYKAALKQLVIRPGRDTCSGRALLEGRTVHIYDAKADPEYNLPDIMKVAGNRAMIGVPLLREGTPIGVLVLTRTVARPFTEKQIALATTFADQAVIAIENTRLFHEIEVKSRELEVASQHKSEFLANMSHELRTPLNAIIGFSEVLSERMFGEINEKQAEYIGDILQSGQHLLSLINDILDLSKIEAGRMELELSNFDLVSTIEGTLTLVRERAVRRGIALGRTTDQRLATVRADERKVKQVLLNLLSNALKFTPEGGKIDVRAAVNDGVVEISVTDTGVGISPEDQDAVFEEFRQVGTASKKVEGTGLGLAISRKFIELHGGRIWVKSTVGSGSTFSFTLPLR